MLLDDEPKQHVADVRIARPRTRTELQSQTGDVRRDLPRRGRTPNAKSVGDPDRREHGVIAELVDVPSALMIEQVLDGNRLQPRIRDSSRWRPNAEEWEDVSRERKRPDLISLRIAAAVIGFVILANLKRAFGRVGQRFPRSSQPNP